MTESAFEKLESRISKLQDESNDFDKRLAVLDVQFKSVLDTLSALKNFTTTFDAAYFKDIKHEIKDSKERLETIKEQILAVSASVEELEEKAFLNNGDRSLSGKISQLATKLNLHLDSHARVSGGFTRWIWIIIQAVTNIAIVSWIAIYAGG